MTPENTFPGRWPAPDAPAATAATAPRFSLLGPVRAWSGTAEIDLGSPQQRALLAILLLRRDQPVPCEHAVRALWGDTAPRSADTTVRTYVYRLRRLLGDLAGDAPEIRKQGGGYLLTAGGATLDTELFRDLLARGREARDRTDPGTALGHLRDALALWRGTPFGEADTPYFAAERERWEQLRSAATEELAAVQIGLGRYAEAVAMLETALAGRPLWEKLWELRVRALAGLGRRADALAAYRDARRLLHTELGLEPGPALRELHRGILALEPTAPEIRPAVRSEELPRLPADFVGRAAELTALTERLTAPGDASGAPVVMSLTGPAGIGKTALALRAAHGLRSHFPDGRLYARLGAPDGTPRPPEDVLGELLTGLGVPAAAVPGPASERAALWRRMTDGRRLLLVLDDAVAGARPDPLLPVSPGSAALLVGRRPPGELQPPGQGFALDGLTLADALQLLGAVVGHERLRQEAEPSARLVSTCAYRPAALRAAAARLLADPRRSVRDVERELRTGAGHGPVELRLGRPPARGGHPSHGVCPRAVAAGAHAADARRDSDAGRMSVQWRST
ncbi:MULTISPECIES: AfsR/SARP family transcriptional regulator [Streptomyces]|uniref:AfsR/SARP family transcriptional regulator n=1 Tax=Streptomyces TaxID=1883 RepID=UPI00163CAD65|nr:MULTISPECIES: BTAD domain-containing putative transcriptional regulator [Streptomyces]MBC2874291.1 AfsR/SARP family transcriptional regulator [Streptomyces sp. TYQ1024]UBI40327.1 AfsR/SARP family transcriptional regulator [Streptomyces mobaraensis]UKW32907.1 AfsR/SARP family transcriptional regulator [Streptomyces sp. TYQ1024]